MAEAEPAKRRPSRAARPDAAGAIEADAAPAPLPPGVAALIQVASLDGVIDGRGPAPAAGAPRRETLVRQVPPEILDAYDRALRAGRRPALAVLDGNVCRGCHMRLHSSLAQRIHSRGAAACPHCLRVVYYEPGAGRS